MNCKGTRMVKDGKDRHELQTTTLVPEAIYKERGAMERGRGAKQGRGKIASGRIRWKSHFHAKPKYRN